MTDLKKEMKAARSPRNFGTYLPDYKASHSSKP